ncbi:hypothetical protein TNCV_1876791 [Trichonephila clavipes]|nr:hypothetical protein TNCV_1876791 [Trichonephila clavipes]
MAKDVLSFLPYLGWRVWHVSKLSPDMITCKPICLRLAWLIHRSPLPVNPGQITGEHRSDCPALLHVLSQDNCGFLLPARATSALYWTARRLVSERTLAGRLHIDSVGLNYLRWGGVEFRRGVHAEVSSSSLDHGSKLRGPSPKALV